MTQGRIAQHLAFLYGAERTPDLLRRLQDILEQFVQRTPQLDPLRRDPSPQNRFTERDVILITYGDQVREGGKRPLRALAEVLETHVSGVINGLHILPFFPYSSDDGFSVIDYTVVSPDLGSWADIERLGRHFRLMFDAVVNHVSAQSYWFRQFLKGKPPFDTYFITVEPGTDLSQVVRPRALPLLTPVQTASGERLVWTTFSHDQIDLNFANPQVLLRMIEILLLYVERGAELIRLDAIAYLWKTIGTSCIHLEETHAVVKLFRAVLDQVAPHVILITETNVPHEENISYFGDGTDEAQMVYQFPLPPLVLNAFHTQDATRLSEWVAQLKVPSERTTFFNFLASHDGIGVRPVEGILARGEIDNLVGRTLTQSGYVSYKTDLDGGRSVYELNISYFDALSSPSGGEPLDVQIKRFLASQAIMLSLSGVPGVYFHSLFGSRSYHAGVEETGEYRAVNREKIPRVHLEAQLADPTSLRHRVFHPYAHLIRKRVGHRAFHPNGPQQILSVNPALFVLQRTAPEGDQPLLCIHNVSSAEQSFQANLDLLALPRGGSVRDLITGARLPADRNGVLSLTVAPYQVLWLRGERR